MSITINPGITFGPGITFSEGAPPVPQEPAFTNPYFLYDVNGYTGPSGGSTGISNVSTGTLPWRRPSPPPLQMFINGGVAQWAFTEGSNKFFRTNSSGTARINNSVPTTTPIFQGFGDTGPDGSFSTRPFSVVIWSRFLPGGPYATLLQAQPRNSMSSTPAGITYSYNNYGSLVVYEWDSDPNNPSQEIWDTGLSLTSNEWFQTTIIECPMINGSPATNTTQVYLDTSSGTTSIASYTGNSGKLSGQRFRAWGSLGSVSSGVGTLPWQGWGEVNLIAIFPFDIRYTGGTDSYTGSFPQDQSIRTAFLNRFYP